MKMILTAIFIGVILGIILILLPKSTKKIKLSKTLIALLVFGILIGIGAGLNGVTVKVNGGQMPVIESATFRDDGNHKVADSHTKLRPLIDRFEFDIFNDGTYSIGDIILSIGTIFFIPSLMMSIKVAKRDYPIHFNSNIIS